MSRCLIYVTKYDINPLAKSPGFSVVSADLTGFVGLDRLPSKLSNYS